MSSAIIHGDCLDVMLAMDENSIDAIVCDPPYGLDFMGKDWDAGVPGKVYWEAAFRVAKPGAYLLAFGGTRKFHRLAVAIEDAGWELRDTIMYCFGSGFPKSLNISKAIDKAAGAERAVVGMRPGAVGQVGATLNQLARKDGADSSGAASCPKYGPGCKSIAGMIPVTAPATDAAKLWDGYGSALKPAYEPVLCFRKPLDGTLAANALKWGVGGLNIDACRVEYQSEADKASAAPAGRCTSKVGALAGGTENDAERTKFFTPEKDGRFPANLIHDGSEEVLACFPESNRWFSKARSTAADGKSTNGTVFTQHSGDGIGYSDSGSAARFFYCAKASTSERNAGCDNLPLGDAPGSKRSTPAEGRSAALGAPRANHHPTVKPVALMEYLVKLVSGPVPGIVLDPFCGSGSTGVACANLGIPFVGIEKEEAYVKIAEARVANAEILHDAKPKEEAK